MNPYVDNAKAFLSRLAPSQRLALGGVIVGGIGLLIAIAYWTSRPDMTLLFGKLGASDANSVVEALRTEGVPYELAENGTAVYVPRDKVYELRLRFAAQGLASDGPVGYELFDAGTLGMTDFMQKLNLKRALEGELARTIASIRQVEMARVHLVVPERSAFATEQKQPTASVVVQTVGGQKLDEQEVEGITSLVAGAVEGLAPENVTILDVRGNLLSNPEQPDADAALTSNQMRAQQAVEVHLAESGQTMLDRVVGPGNSIVRVSASLDFSRGVQERDLIDPESQTVVSEEKLDEQSGGDAATSQVRNYELSRTRERIEKSTGDVKYLTVSVILNQKLVAVGEGEEARTEPRPYTEAEIGEIEALVQNAVGFNPERGDRIALHQTRFDTTADEVAEAQIKSAEQQEMIQVYLRYGLVLLAIALVFWLVRSATRRLTAPQAPVQLEARQTGPQKLGASRVTPEGKIVRLGENGEEVEEEDTVMIDDIYTSRLSVEAKARLKAKHLVFEEIKEHVQQRPNEAADLIRSWLADDIESGRATLKIGSV